MLSKVQGCVRSGGGSDDQEGSEEDDTEVVLAAGSDDGRACGSQWKNVLGEV